MLARRFPARTIQEREVKASTRNSNRVLDSLKEVEYRELLGRLRPVALRRGAGLYEAGEPMRFVWFPTTSIISLVFGIEDEAATEVILAGREEIVGLWEILGGGIAPGRALVQQSGHALRVPQEVFQRMFDADIKLQRLVQRSMLSFLVQSAYTAMCNRYHPVVQQLARALLMRLDRLDGPEIEMTHDMLAYVLGVRRPGITEAANKLQQRGFIENRRGRIIVLDRPGLESAACSCYAAITLECDRVRNLPPPAGVA